MNKVCRIGFVLLVSLALPMSFNACTGNGFNLDQGSVNLGSLSSPQRVIDGKALYTTNCSGCHSPIDISVKKDRTFEQITAALATIPDMAGLRKSLTAEQVRAISTALRSTGPGADGTACLISSVGTTPIRRLSRSELQNSLVDLLGVNQDFVSALEVDPPGVSGFSNDATGLPIGYVQLGKIITAVEKAVTAALAAPNSAFLKCTGNVQDVNCAKTQLQALARRAYRRTLNATAVNALTVVYTTNQSSGFTTALSLAMQRVLLSPYFMYVTAFSGGATAKGKALTSQEFAGRLALFLWNSVPDVRLLDLADQGTLRQEATLKAEIARMLKDPRASRFSDNLFKEWLGYDTVGDASVVIRDGMTPQLRQDMVTETSTFLKSLFTEDRSIASLITADYTYLNANMAAHYGISGVTGTAFQRVPLAANTGRKGVLSQASLMTLMSNQDDSRPVPRGHFLLDKIICQSPKPPPPDVDTGALESGDQTELTVRDRMARHRSEASCAGCHAQMDPMGLAFENFNQLGQYRTIYANGKPVDATGEVYQKSFNGYMELNAILSQQSAARACMASRVLSYAVQRPISDDERCMGNKIAAVAAQDASKLSELIYQIVTNDMFNFNVSDSN